MSFNEKLFLKKVKEVVKKEDYCVIVVSEGTKYKNGKFLADAGTVDSFGHKQLGGVAPRIAEMISNKLGLNIIGQSLTTYNVLLDIFHPR